MTKALDLDQREPPGGKEALVGTGGKANLDNKNGLEGCHQR